MRFDGDPAARSLARVIGCDRRITWLWPEAWVVVQRADLTRNAPGAAGDREGSPRPDHTYPILRQMEPLRLTESRSRVRVCDPQRTNDSQPDRHSPDKHRDGFRKPRSAPQAQSRPRDAKSEPMPRGQDGPRSVLKFTLEKNPVASGRFLEPP